MECKTCTILFNRKESIYYLNVLGENCFFCSKNCLTTYAIKTTLKRLINNTDVILDKTSCWNYKKLGKDGYGKITFLNKTLRAHRVIMHLVHGFDLKSNMQMCHRCDNPACIRPSHLFPGTGAINAQDKVLKGRVPKVKRSKTSGYRLEIALKYLEGGITMKELSKKYNIAAAQVHKFVHKYLKGLPVDV